jgi:epoxyqueuosine reductase
MNAEQRTAWIVSQAKQIGFDLCGVVGAEEWPESERLAEWLSRGYAGEMKYLHDARRSSIVAAMPEARSVIVCALNYNTANPKSTEAAAVQSTAIRGAESPRGWVSRYAWGDDYHGVIGAKLEALVAAARAEFAEEFEAKWYVDTGPVMERIAAQQAGLGWLAKNTLLINSEIGSWFFLSVILTSLELAATNAGTAPADLCGQCTLCIEACPTGAITEPYVLDARRCISYLTIELRGAIPEELREEMGRQMFGCDICQDVCPWNRGAPITSAEAFMPRPGMIEPDLERLASLSEMEFRELTRDSPVRRAKWRGLVRNACVALGNARLEHGSEAHKRVTALLERLACAGDALVAEHAVWALKRLKGGAQKSP